jgi:hypothetical protein
VPWPLASRHIHACTQSLIWQGVYWGGGVQILNQFGELPADLADVQRYAAWKAADIGKALREGRQPTPGPPPSANADGLDSSLGSGLDLPPPPGASPVLLTSLACTCACMRLYILCV